MDFYEEYNIWPWTFFYVAGYEFADKYGWEIDHNFLQEEEEGIDPVFQMGEIPEEAFALLTPETVTPAVLYMVSAEAPNKTIICAGAGAYSVAKIVETDGVWLKPEEQTPEGLAAHWAEITSTEGERVPEAGFEQTVKFTGKAMDGLGLAKD